MYAAASVGLWVVDSAVRYLSVNEILASLHGRFVDAHLGRSLVVECVCAVTRESTDVAS